MPEKPSSAEQFLVDAQVDEAVFQLCPTYRTMLIVAEGLTPAPSNEVSDELVDAAEAHAKKLLAERPVEEIAHVAAWRDAYRAFGAKPQRTRNSLESLLRRAETGLPRVNALTDIYNAISVLHQVPLGGEDLAYYQGPARLVRAAGNEDFDVVANGVEMLEHPDAGEVVWRDDLGVTCRRWNWRQGRRTGLSDATESAFFIFDALDPMTDDAVHTAAGELADAFRQLGPHVRVTGRMVAAS
ncbi:phenylalanine--tRNA ligase beta subunit-related protein [Saxibacter everestensis]|uniref:Phenylalanine--tRNA ligase beta subunit-related protein n=1 Tax=Saxibacter everestensis TaxID=2909229 RepID=A0ABY8QZR5_9MICO|nr:phenylalanine--tRNA ligase beta subunit-related protein [Brevibacteriaceae bacterium ZFBP1038]